MTRSRTSAKQAGSKFNQDIATHLRTHVDDGIERRVTNGSKDRGDITGLRSMGNRLVVECKDYGGVIHSATWIAEAELEAGNDDAAAGIVIAKRKGVTAPGKQWVLMDVDTLITLITGQRPE